MAEMEFRHAIRDALREELRRDDRVIFFGEDVAVAGGVFAVTPGLYEEFGVERVFDTPISELALAGAAYGSALCGLRPVLEIMFGDFLPLVGDMLINQATKSFYLSGGTRPIPMVIRGAYGAGGRFGAIHSQNPISWFTGVPGLKIVSPSTPADAKGLLTASIRDDNPVIYLEHKRLYSIKGDVPEGEHVVSLGSAAVVRPGSDITIVALAKTVHDALEAAAILEGRGVSAEVIDLRTVRPLDEQTVLESVRKTNRIVAIEEGPLPGGWAADVIATVTELGLGDLDDAWRIGTPSYPVPYSPPLEDAFLPHPQRIADEILARG